METKREDGLGRLPCYGCDETASFIGSPRDLQARSDSNTSLSHMHKLARAFARADRPHKEEDDRIDHDRKWYAN